MLSPLGMESGPPLFTSPDVVIHADITDERFGVTHQVTTSVDSTVPIDVIAVALVRVMRGIAAAHSPALAEALTQYVSDPGRAVGDSEPSGTAGA